MHIIIPDWMAGRSSQMLLGKLLEMECLSSVTVVDSCDHKSPYKKKAGGSESVVGVAAMKTRD